MVSATLDVMSYALTAQVLDQQSNQSFEASFQRFPVRIGRNQLADLRIDRPYVSQFHASIEIQGDQIWVKDLGSTNGTLHRGVKMVRDAAVNVSETRELQIGPVVIRLQLTSALKADTLQNREMPSLLDLGTPAGAALMDLREHRPSPGQSDPFVRQVEPYIEAYRQAWSNVYRLVYEHLTRLGPEVRTDYLKRLIIEHPALAGEADFQKIARYYGVACEDWGELVPTKAAMLALTELSRQLAPELPPPDDASSILAFSKRLRDAMHVFLKCFVSLRDGYQEFEVEVLRRERFEETGNQVGTAKDGRALGRVLFAGNANSQVNSHQLHEIFVEVMTHQVALLNGVMEGVKQLLDKLSPGAIEKAYDQKGKRGGLFSNKYEGLWQAYHTVHGDYQGEDKETFLIIFGPQFSRAYAATTGEAYQTSGEAAGDNVNRLSTGIRTRR